MLLYDCLELIYTFYIRKNLRIEIRLFMHCMIIFDMYYLGNIK